MRTVGAVLSGQFWHGITQLLQVFARLVQEASHHSHKPWGLVTSAEGTHFSTSEETAYPKPLANAIALVFANILTKHGWNPPAESLDALSEPSLKFMRAIATVQPKAAQIPPVVREHKQVVIVKGPTHVLQIAPVQAMQRLKQPWEVPTACTSTLPTLPIGAQLLRTTPLRSNGVYCKTTEPNLENQTKHRSKLGAFHFHLKGFSRSSEAWASKSFLQTGTKNFA